MGKYKSKILSVVTHSSKETSSTKTTKTCIKNKNKKNSPPTVQTLRLRKKKKKKNKILSPALMLGQQFKRKSPTHPRLHPKDDYLKSDPNLNIFVRQLTSRSGMRSYEVFESVDVDGDGKVSVRDFEETCRSLNLGISPEEVHSLFRFIDLNSSEFIEFDEFVIAMKIGGWKPQESDGLMIMRTPDHDPKSYLDDSESSRGWAEMQDPSLVQPMFKNNESSSASPENELWNEVKRLSLSHHGLDMTNRYRPQTANSKSDEEVVVSTRVKVSKTRDESEKHHVVLSRISSGLVTGRKKIKLKAIPDNRDVDRKNLVSRKGVLLAERYPIGRDVESDVDNDFVYMEKESRRRTRSRNDVIKKKPNVVAIRSRPQTTSISYRFLDAPISLRETTRSSTPSSSSSVHLHYMRRNIFPLRPNSTITSSMRRYDHVNKTKTKLKCSWRSRYGAICKKYDI